MPKESIENIEEVDQGYSNHCFRVVTELGDVYKVRIGSNNEIIDRENELNILKNIGAQYFYFSSENGDSVWPWFKGNSLLGTELNEKLVGKIARLIQEFHLNKVDGIVVHDDFEYEERFSHHLEEKYRKIYHGILGKYKEDKKCLCHNDVSLSNLIYDPEIDKVTLIDFEWGRVNNPYWDYGNFVKESDLSESLIEVLTNEADLSIVKLYEFAIISSIYSIQLSYAFNKQTESLEKYRSRLKLQINKYILWLEKRL